MNRLKQLLFITTLVAGIFFATPLVQVSAAGSASATTPQSPITVETIPGPTVAQKVISNAHTSWPWYLVRGSGMVAAITLIILILSGIGQITGHTYRFLQPLTAWATHRALGILFAITVLIHMGGLLFDHFLPFTVLQLLVPWLSNYKPAVIFGVHLGSFYVACGVLSFYATALIVVTSLVWIEKKPYIWKLLHFLSYLTIAMVFVHALYIGTDTSHGWVRTAWLSLAVAIVVASVVRLRRAFTA